MPVPMLWRPRAQLIGHLAHHVVASVCACLTLAHEGKNGGVLGAEVVVRDKAGFDQLGFHGADQV
jgi:hypothetical protein